MQPFAKATVPAFQGVASIVLTLLLSGCTELPRDPHGATEHIQRTQVLTVGVSGDGASSTVLEQRERRLVETVARRLGARVAWRRGNVHALLEDLETRKLPLVAASIPAGSPFAGRVGLSQPYRTDGPRGADYCLAVAPGENRLLLLVDQIIAEERGRGRVR
jgi:hypothetical protein